MFWRLLGVICVLLLASLSVVAITWQGGPWQSLALAAAVGGLGAAGSVWWLTRRDTRGLRRLGRALDRIASGHYGKKTYVAGPQEFRRLGQSLNAMSERLADQFRRLEDDRRQLRTILSGMVEGVVALDDEQRVLFVNERAAAFLETQSQTMVGRKLWEVIRQRAIHDLVGAALADQESHSAEILWSGVSTRSLTVRAAALPGSPPPGAVLVLQDTTDLRRLEHLRQDFVANVSHELKTPLAVIKACIETLLDGAVEDASHRGRFLEQISEQADHLHSLILDLLSLARIESGTELFEFQEVPLEPLVDYCLLRHRARADSKNQHLEAVALPRRDGQDLTTPHSEVAAWADEEAVSQILDNLVDNAVKYTPPGGRICVKWWSEPDEVCLEVEDTGIGIPEHDLPRIFERFYRVDKARSRAPGGTGLGLSIVKHLVQAMHGTVHATSTMGTGTIFSVRLPRAPAA